MTHYVLGFALNAARDYVVLIKKNKPEWQKGLFNGVGGKIENDETPEAAMIREFGEETGIETYEGEWQHVAKMKGDDWDCHVFTMSNDELMGAKTMTDEEISVLPVQEVINGDYPMISNIPFLIELCRDAHRPLIVNLQY